MSTFGFLVNRFFGPDSSILASVYLMMIWVSVPVLGDLDLFEPLGVSSSSSSSKDNFGFSFFFAFFAFEPDVLGLA